MARPIRVEFTGAVYHVIARGNEGRAIFFSVKDRRVFLGGLKEASGRFGFVIHAYCLMPNHYHLIIETPRGNLSQGMAWLQTTYTVRFNKHRGRIGHLFQGRYKAFLVESDLYATELIRYIHLNPIRPKDKTKPILWEKREILENYPWSSHLDYSGQRSKSEPWLNLEWQRYWGKSRNKAEKEYRREIRSAFEKPMENPLDRAKGGLLLGSEELWQKVKGMIRGKKGIEEIRWKVRDDQKEMLKKVENMIRTETDPYIQMWLQVKCGGRKVIEIAHQHGYASASGVLMSLKRLERKREMDPYLHRKLTALEQTMGP
jgi:REP element-mobilizing transposase RayT